MTGLRALSIEQAVLPAPRWVDRAACRYSEDPELFFDKGADITSVPAGRPSVSKENADRREKAKAYCRRCPVIDLCREHYIEEAHGVYGGLDKDERRALRIARAAIARADDDPDDVGREAYALHINGLALTELAAHYKLRPGQLRAFMDAYLRTPDGQRAQLEHEVRSYYEGGSSVEETAIRLNIPVRKVAYIRAKLGLSEKRELSAAQVKLSEDRWDSSVVMPGGAVMHANYMGESADGWFFMQIKYAKASTRKWVPEIQVNLGESVRRYVISKGVGSGKKRDGNTQRSA